MSKTRAKLAEVNPLFSLHPPPSLVSKVSPGRHVTVARTTNPLDLQWPRLDRRQEKRVGGYAVERSAARGSEQLEEALRLEVDLGYQALQTGDRGTAWNGLFNVLSRLPMTQRSPESDALFVWASLQLSDLGFAMGKGFADLTDLLTECFKRSRAPRRQEIASDYQVAPWKACTISLSDAMMR